MCVSTTVFLITRWLILLPYCAAYLFQLGGRIWHVRVVTPLGWTVTGRTTSVFALAGAVVYISGFAGLPGVLVVQAAYR